MIRFTILMAGVVATGPAFAGGSTPSTWQEPITKMEFVHVPAGCFQMGNVEPVTFREEYPGLPLTQRDMPFDDELPQHEVCVDALWMGRHEVRVGEWQRLMGGDDERAEFPIADISWEQATAFAERLSVENDGRYRYRLPTEAEWEYACRAGQEAEIVPTSGELAALAWYNFEPDGVKTASQAVGQLEANALGLHDMLGNVWEWVHDHYRHDAYAQHELYNPVIEAGDAGRVIRGASFRSQPLHVRCAERAFYEPSRGRETIGFRLVRIP